MAVKKTEPCQRVRRLIEMRQNFFDLNFSGISLKVELAALSLKKEKKDLCFEIQ